MGNYITITASDSSSIVSYSGVTTQPIWIDPLPMSTPHEIAKLLAQFPQDMHEMIANVMVNCSEVPSYDDVVSLLPSSLHKQLFKRK